MSTPPTKKEIERVKELQSKRAELDRASWAIKSELDTLKQRIVDWLEAKKRKAATRLGFAIVLTKGNKYPKWKEAFIDQLGEEAAKEVESSTPNSAVLTITKVEE